MDGWNLKWLAEEPNSKSPSPISQEPLFTEGSNLHVNSPIFSRDSNDSFVDDKLQKLEKRESALLNTSLKNISLAKKRLQAYNIDYIQKISTEDNDAQEKEQPDRDVKNKKVFYPDDESKAVIHEIGEIKIPENEELGKEENIAKCTISGNINYSITSRSQSPEVVNHFKKRKIKSRNYRQTDSFFRKSTSPGDQHRRSDKRPSTENRKTSLYPNNWTEYKEQRLTIPKDEELKVKCFPKVNHTSAELFSKLYNISAPSKLLEPFRYSSEQQIKTVPIHFLRLTKSRPPIMYSINSERNKESYLSREELFQIIPKARVQMIENLINKQSKLQPVNRTDSSRPWFNKAWRKPGDQVSKVIENSVGLSFLQNYSDEDEDNETDDIIICSSVKKNDKNIEAAESKSERHDQTPPQPFEFPVDMNQPSYLKENTFIEEETVSERKEHTFTAEDRSRDISEERLTPERNSISFDNFENNDVSLTPKRGDFEHGINPLHETRMAIQKIEEELEKRHLELIEEPQERSGSRKRKKKNRDSESKNRGDSSLEDGGSLKTKKKKKKKRKKSCVEDDSSNSEDEKHKKSKKKKDKTNKKKRKNLKDDSNKMKKRSSEVREEYSKNKNKDKKSNITDSETKLSAGDSRKKNKKKSKKEKHRRYSESVFLTDEDVGKFEIPDKATVAGEFIDPKITKKRPEEIEPDQDLRNLLHQLEKRKEDKIKRDHPLTDDPIRYQDNESIQDLEEQERKFKKEKYSQENYTAEDIELLKKDKDATKRREEKVHMKDKDELIDEQDSKQSSKKRKSSKEIFYSEELFEIDKKVHNIIKLKSEHNWEDHIGTYKKENSKKKKRRSPNILEDFPLEKNIHKDSIKFKGGTPDTEEYRGNWESDDEIAPKPADKPNTSWESDDDVFETNRFVEKKRELTEIQDLHIPLTFKPFTRREPKIINFKLELPELEREFHSPELPKKEEEQSIKIDDAVEEPEQIQSEAASDVKIENNEETGVENFPKRRRSQDEVSNENKKSRWDKKNLDEPKSVDSSISIDPVPDAESPVETSKVLENEYEEFMKAVSTTVGSITNTSLNDSVITLSSDSNGSVETPIPNKKLFGMKLGSASTPIKIDLSDEIDVPEVVIAPKDIPFIPMPVEVKLAPQDIPFIPMPGEIQPALKDIPFTPIPEEVKPVPSPIIVPENTTTSSFNLGLLCDIAPVLPPQTDISLMTVPPKIVFPVMPLTTNVTETEGSVSSRIYTHDPNIDTLAEGSETIEKGNEAPVKDNEAPVKGNEAPVKGNETPVKGNETSVKSNEAPVKGSGTPTGVCETPVNDSEILEVDIGTLVVVSETLAVDSETPVKDIEASVKDIVAPVKGDETSDIIVKGSDNSVKSNVILGDIQTPTNPKTIEKPFSLVLPLKKTLVTPRLNFGDSDDEAEKSKKTIDEIKQENLVELAEIQKCEEKETAEKQVEIGKEKSDAKKKERTRSHSPATKKSAASQPKPRTERKPSDSHSSSRSKRRDSPRRRDVSPPKRRDKSPRRRGVSPRRRESSPKKRGHSPKRNSSPRRRSSPGRRRYSSRKSTSPSHRRRSLSPRRKSPKRGSSPRNASKHAKRPRSRSPKSTAKTRDSVEKANVKKRSKSSSGLEASKKSVADSTISDESLLTQQNSENVGQSPLVNHYKSDSTFAPKQLPSQLVDYSKEQLSLISTTYDNFSYERKNLPQILQSIEGFSHAPVTERPMNSYSEFVQVGNMVQIVPTDLHMKTDYKRTDTRNEGSVAPEKKMQIVQVGNMLQIVPTELPPLPPYPPPLPPEERKKDFSEVFEAKLEPEKQSAEMSMKQKVAERRAERDKRRLERETRRKEKERRRREKEKDRQVKLKQKTENMIKRALELEVEGGEENSLLNETPAQWPPLPALVSCSKESRGILVRGQRSKKSIKSDKKKNVQFADGIRPGEGTSPSAGEELSSPPPCKTLPKEKRYTKTKLGKNKKRKVKVKIIKSIETENSDEEDNLPPPSPPPGSPPPHVFPSRIKPQPTVVSNMLPQYVPSMATLQQPVQNPALYRPPPMNVVMGHPAAQMHRAHMPPTPPQRHLSVHPAEAMAHHHGMPPIHLAPPPPPPPPPPTSRPGTPLGPTHRNISYHYQM